VLRIGNPRARSPLATEIVECQPLPYWYPRGWELMVRYPCYTYGAYGPYRRSSSYAVHPVQRRPYLRPGWWW